MREQILRSWRERAPGVVVRLAQIAIAALAAVSGTAFAQEALRFDQKYVETVKSSTDIAPVAMGSFGDNIDLASGSVEFKWTDIDIPGNNALPVRLQRKLSIAGLESGRLGGFGTFADLDLPYMTGSFSSDGWVTNGANPNARCTAPGNPPSYNGGVISAPDYWGGNWLHIPGEGELAVLTNPDPKLPRLTGSTTLMTRNFWAFKCLATTSNGYPGEGFVAISPHGEKYYFDWVVTRSTGTMSKRYGNYGGSPGPSVAVVSTAKVYFLASKIEDRFGNWVQYAYSGDKLTSITSNDGRSIQLTWSGDKIASAASSAGTWQYTYGTNSLIVTRPDGSTWKQASTGVLRVEPSPFLPLYSSNLRCPLPDLSTGDYSIAVTQPSGATATYEFAVKRHFKSNIPETCNSFIDGELSNYMYLTVPNFNDSFTLVRETVTGPGLSGLAWDYQYGGGGPLAFEDVCADPPSEYACPSTRWTEVRGPEHSYQRYTFGNMFNVNSGQLLAVDEGYEDTSTSPSGIVFQKSTDTTFMDAATAAGQLFPAKVGSTGSWRFDDSERSFLRPVTNVTISQDGAIYSRTDSAFTRFAMPGTAVRQSSFGQALTDTTTYEDNTTLWVLGQVKRKTSGGAEVLETVYDPATALPTRVERFGKLLQTYTYHLVPGSQGGTLATVADGLQNTTSLSNWKRGIPQTIGFADGTSISAVVGDDGLIDSATDEAGETTGYLYDAMGRLAQISYPTTGQLWNATTQVFVPVSTAEKGLAAGHWRQTVSTGNARKITYYDSLWRPVLIETFDAGNKAATLSQRVQRYDGSGRVAFQSYPVDTVTSYATVNLGIHTTYDSIGRVEQVSQDAELPSVVTTRSYGTDAIGAYTQVVDPNNNVTKTWFQAYDTPSEEFPVKILHPEDAYTHITRNQFGNPTRIRRSNISSQSGGTLAVNLDYVYNGFQELCSVTEPETGTTLMGYDAAGNLSWSASGLAVGTVCDLEGDTTAILARKAVRTYDARNRVETLSFPDLNGNQSWTYTATGRPETVTTWNDGGATTVVNSYSYDNRNLLTSESSAQPGWYTFTANYGYDGNGNLASLTYPGGLIVDYAPNALGQPTKAGTYATNVSYWPNGAIKQFTYGNGIVHTMTRNARGLPEESRDAYGATNILQDFYDYDAAGNVAAISDGATGQAQRGNRTMTYDGLDRLTDVASPMYGTAGAHYTYDVLDNLTRTIAVNRDQRLCYDQFNQLTNVKVNGDCSTGSTILGLGYDPQGNLANWNGVEYAFDYGNRLRSVEGLEAYRYDGHGRRVLATSLQGLGNILSMYRQAGQLLWQQDTRSSQWRDFIYLGGSLVAERAKAFSTGAATVTYQHTDALGTPVAKTNASRVVMQRSEYEPYGKLLNRALENGPGYTGHVTDAATQLTYMQQRYYDPRVGRFWSTDPVTVDSAGGNFNRYWYGNNNPYRFTDPDGRSGVAALGGVVTETWDAINGRGFDGAMVWGALKDGYNGEGDGVIGATLQDGAAVATVAGGLGALRALSSLAARQLAREGAKQAIRKLEPSAKTIAKIERQFERYGLKSVLKSQQKLERRLAEHEVKLGQIKEAGGYTSSVEREMAGFRKELEAIKRFVDKNHL